MKFAAPSDRALFWVISPVAIPALVVAAPFVLLLAGLIWLNDRLWPCREWQPWFAWRPVALDQYPKQWAWLETVDRARFHAGDGWTYREQGDHRFCRDDRYWPRDSAVTPNGTAP